MPLGLRPSSIRLHPDRPAPAWCRASALLLLAVPAFATHATGAPAPYRPVPGLVTSRQSGPGAEADTGRTFARVWIPREKTGALQLHGGVFAPINGNSASALLGARIGIHVGEPLLLGFRTGWTYYSKSALDTVDSGLSRLGLEPHLVRATGEAHLIPAMLFLEVTLTDRHALVPYAGIGAGYEWLRLRARDFVTDADSAVTYSNLAWEWYAGVGLKVSRGLRVDAEAFYNGGTLGRDVTDQNGVRRREVLDVDGTGARLGLHIVY